MTTDRPASAGDKSALEHTKAITDEMEAPSSLREALTHCIGGGSTFDHQDRLDMVDEILATVAAWNRRQPGTEREKAPDLQFPEQQGSWPDPNDPSTRLIGWRVRAGDQAFGEYGVSEPLFWLDRVKAAALRQHNAEASAPESEAVALPAILEPFAAVADAYSDSEDDAFEVWRDSGEPAVRSMTKLANFRAARTYLRALRSAPEAPRAALQAEPVVAWRCFHCDEVFADEHAARLHFGRNETVTPACQIKGSEHGLVEALRRAETDAAEAWFAILNETTDAAKAYHAQHARHQEQLRAIEQFGYDRGLADAKAHPETLGLTLVTPPSPAPAGALVEALEAAKYLIGRMDAASRGATVRDLDKAWSAYVTALGRTKAAQPIERAEQ